MRDRGRPLRGPLAIAATLVAVLSACERRAPVELRPDELLRQELGLTDFDRVHRVTLTASDRETPAPDTIQVREGDWVEFVTGDGRVHEVRFDLPGSTPAAKAFLERTDQAASPPLLSLGDRFVLSFLEAPPGAYPYVVEGNGAPGAGVVIVLSRQ